MNIVNCGRQNCCMRVISSHTLNQVTRNSFSLNRNNGFRCCPNCGWNLSCGCLQNGCGCGCGCNGCACPLRLENSCV